MFRQYRDEHTHFRNDEAWEKAIREVKFEADLCPVDARTQTHSALAETFLTNKRDLRARSVSFRCPLAKEACICKEQTTAQQTPDADCRS